MSHVGFAVFREELSLRASHPEPRSHVSQGPRRLTGLCSTYFNVVGDFLLISKIRPVLQQEGKERKRGCWPGREWMRNLCTDAQASTPNPEFLGKG